MMALSRPPQRCINGQWLLTLQNAACAQHARPGHYLHAHWLNASEAKEQVRCPILRADVAHARVEVLTPILIPATPTLSDADIAALTLQPELHGSDITPIASRPQCLVLCDDAHLASACFLVESLQRDEAIRGQTLLLIEAAHALPLRLRPSRLIVAGMPDKVIATPIMLDDRGIAARISTTHDWPGCYQAPDAGSSGVVALAQRWLHALHARDAEFSARTQLLLLAQEQSWHAELAQMAAKFALPLTSYAAG